MPKYIELIDKYLIRQETGDYNPPSYIWTDNTGEIIRCKACSWYVKVDGERTCRRTNKDTSDGGFCAWAKRKK